MNLHDLTKLCADEAKAIELFESLRWPDGPRCPHCELPEGEAPRVYRLTGVKNKKGRERLGLWKCGHCRKQFTARVGSIFEDSKIPISKWLIAIYMMCGSKKGVSAMQLQRALGLHYRSAWFMCMRVRDAMREEPLASKLGAGGGIVELDETFVGGVPHKNKHRRAMSAKKAIIMTLVDREGDARAFVVPDTKKGTLQAVARPLVDGTAHIVTDENPSYRGIDKHFASHHTVDHSQTYVRSLIFHTNFSESYHSLLKRGIVGAFHHVSEKHLQRYADEFSFRWNRRRATDGQRVIDAIAGSSGKRLMYKVPVQGRSKAS